MIYLFLANGIEEIEALTPVDLLRRAELDVRTVGIGSTRVTGKHGITVQADISEADFTDHMPDMIILPGGMPGTTNLDNSSTVDTAIKCAIRNDAYIAAICAAPMILGKRGILSGKYATCFPGFEKYLIGADIRYDVTTIKDGKVITSAGPGAALDFSLEIIATLKGKSVADTLRKDIIAER